MESVEEKKPKNDGEKPKFVARTPTDIQRIKLERLMKNPQKEVVIPSSSSRKNGGDGFGDTPSFVRNVMGSSAGAGSGEFHVYRHLRRKEYARQKQLQQQSLKEQMEDEFRQKLEQNRLQAEQKTAKKRAKRLKKKQRAKHRKPNDSTKANEVTNSENSNSESEDENNKQENDDADADEKEKEEEKEKSSQSNEKDVAEN